MENNSKKDLIGFWTKNKIVRDKKIINAFKQINRKNFVLEEYKDHAYDDHPLNILKGQTISQPTTVMLMLQALDLKSGQRVLEIGAGSGYNAALISRIIGSNGRLFSLEIIPELVDFAKSNLKKQSVDNVKVIHSDGSQGYKKQAPFDRIIVTAAAPQVPKTLVDQLKINGILLIPTGKNFQHMLKVKKLKNKVITKDLGEFMFVPLKGKFGV